MELKAAGDSGQLWTSENRMATAVDLSQRSKEAEKLQEISQEFESLFVDMMLQSMRKAIPKSGFIDGGNAEDIYRAMLDSEYAKIIAKHGDAGLASMVEKQLLQIMGKRQLEAGPLQAIQGKQAYNLKSE